MLDVRVPLNRALLSCIFWAMSSFMVFQEKHRSMYPAMFEHWQILLCAAIALGFLVSACWRGGPRERWVSFLGFVVAGGLMGISDDETAFLAAIVGVGTSLILAISLQPRSGPIVNRFR